MPMNTAKLRQCWLAEQSLAHVCGWDFSHIAGRYEEAALPWSYADVVRRYLKENMMLLDYDTGGGEVLLSLGHPYAGTAATEGYAPNVQLCKERLEPRGIDFRECSDAAHIPFPDESFDIILNRHGDFEPTELHRLLRRGGLFITQQVGEDNDRELVEMVLPQTPKPFSHLNLREQRQAFADAGFRILEEDEAFRPIRFFDVGAFVWFARIIEWEFPNFSVERCFEQLLNMHQAIERNGSVEGTVHRYHLLY